MPRENGQRRSKGQRERDRHEMVKLWCQGTPIHKIAERLNVSDRTVWTDLGDLRRQWVNEMRSSVDECVAEQFKKIDHLETTAYSAWLRSCEVEETTQSTASDSPRGKLSKITRTHKGKPGDPRFLQQVQWCIEQRLKLVGAYAPERLIDATPAQFVDIEIESHEQFLEYKEFKRLIQEQYPLVRT
jgi:hypothetical protein